MSLRLGTGGRTAESALRAAPQCMTASGGKLPVGSQSAVTSAESENGGLLVTLEVVHLVVG